MAGAFPPFQFVPVVQLVSVAAVHVKGAARVTELEKTKAKPAKMPAQRRGGFIVLSKYVHVPVFGKTNFKLFFD